MIDTNWYREMYHLNDGADRAVHILCDEIDRLRAEVTILRSEVLAAASTWEAVEIEHDDDCDWCPKCQGL